MSLRLLEFTTPESEVGRLAGVLEGQPVVHVWTSESTGTGRLVRVLVKAEDTETLSDLLVSRLGSQDGFRLILLPVEATIPAVEEPPAVEGAGSQSPEPPRVGPQRISREELYEDLAQASRLTPVYAIMVALSTVVAAVGLIRNDVAVIIGAMVIAPLLGPNVALSLAATLGDPELAKRSLRAIGVGVAIAAGLSLLIGAVLEFDPHTPQVAARTRPDVADIVLALAAGTAGSLAFTSGVPAVVVGVMVAVALLPPLVAAGLLLGAGYTLRAAGALMLTVTNVTCVNLAAVVTFLLQAVRPRTWWEADRARRATRTAVLTWIAMLLVLLGLMLLSRAGAV